MGALKWSNHRLKSEHSFLIECDEIGSGNFKRRVLKWEISREKGRWVWNEGREVPIEEH